MLIGEKLVNWKMCSIHSLTRKDPGDFGSFATSVVRIPLACVCSIVFIVVAWITALCIHIHDSPFLILFEISLVGKPIFTLGYA